jgi:hypothetical protein
MNQNQIAIVLLLLILPIFFFLIIRVREGKAGRLRTLPALTRLPDAVGHSAETGQLLHVSVGVSGVGGPATAETWAGLTVLSKLADEAAACDTPLLVTVADPTVVPLAQDIVRRAFIRHGNPDSYDPTQVRFIAPEPVAYAAGVMGLYDRERLAGSVMIGAFGPEYLLMGEIGARRGLHQVVGTANPDTLSLVYASADETLIGEEMFAGGAYLTRAPAQIASLLAEDWARWLVVLAIIIAAVARILL